MRIVEPERCTVLLFRRKRLIAFYIEEIKKPRVKFTAGRDHRHDIIAHKFYRVGHHLINSPRFRLTCVVINNGPTPAARRDKNRLAIRGRLAFGKVAEKLLAHCRGDDSIAGTRPYPFRLAETVARKRCVVDPDRLVTRLIAYDNIRRRNDADTKNRDCEKQTALHDQLLHIHHH